MCTVRSSSCLSGGSTSVHAGIPTPRKQAPPPNHAPPRDQAPPCGQTDTCKNITFATSFRTVMTGKKNAILVMLRQFAAGWKGIFRFLGNSDIFEGILIRSSYLVFHLENTVAFHDPTMAWNRLYCKLLGHTHIVILVETWRCTSPRSLECTRGSASHKITPMVRLHWEWGEIPHVSVLPQRLFVHEFHFQQ